MLKIQNIKVNNGVVSAEYDPESSGKLGYFSVSEDSMDVIESRYSELDEPYPMYFNHAIKAIKKMIQSNRYLSEKTVMWY